MKFEDYASRIALEVADTVDRDGISATDAFTEVVVQRLIDLGEMQACVVAELVEGSMGLNGWSYEEFDGSLHLLVIDVRGGNSEELRASQVDAAFRRLAAFVNSALGADEREWPDGPIADAAETVRREWSRLVTASFHLLTDAVTETRVMKSTVEVGGVDVTRQVWDLGRLFRLEVSGVDREPISVDFEELYGEPIQCIAGPEADDHSVYLALFPGEVLAAVYNEHGPRLLERNVRSFLQARGSVNKGIRSTILDAPGRFLAYNNGISATASSVNLVYVEGIPRAISSLHDFQIVNGGQTTASIAAAATKDLADLSGLSVQAKITVVEPAVVDELVQHISQYSNTQNKVTGADFSANDRFHVAIERFSRDECAPSEAHNGGSYWYYERTRGGFADDAARARTVADRRRFRIRYPSSQKFGKADLAKFEHSWEQLPHFVSLGAEKNFREFTLRLGERYFVPDVGYFRRLVAKGILFRATERIVTELGFGGFRANIVTYTVSKLSNATSQRLDLDGIWSAQAVSNAVEDAIRAIAPIANELIRNPRGRVSNPTEWAKKSDLWELLRNEEWEVPSALRRELIALRGEGSGTEGDRKVIDKGIGTLTVAESKLIEQIAGIPPETWFRLSHWAKETNNLLPWQRSLAYSLGGLASRGRPPSVKQATQGAKMLAAAQTLGFS